MFTKLPSDKVGFFSVTASLGQEQANAWQMESGVELYHSVSVCD